MKTLGKFDIFAIVLGAIIGWGSFVLPGTMFLKEAGVINTAIGIFLGALCIVVIESNYRVMLENHQEEGGEFSYTYHHLNKMHGFIVGWFLTLAYLTMIPLNATAIPMVLQKLLGNIFQFGYLYDVAGYDVYLGEILVSSVIILAFGWLNIKGLKKTSRIQNVMILSLIVIVFGLFIGLGQQADVEKFTQTYIANYEFSLREVLVIFSITPFAFIGFDAIPQLVKSFDFTPKKVSSLAIISLLVGALFYNILNVATAFAFSPSEAMNLDWALGTAVQQHFGVLGFTFLIIAVSAAVFGGVNGFMICSSKLVSSLSSHQMLPKEFSFSTRAIVFTCFISLVAPWFGRQVITWIVDMSSLGAAIAYFYVSYIALRYASSTRRKLGSWFGIAISITFILLLILPASPAWLGTEAFIALLIWSGLGACFYLSVLSDRVVKMRKKLNRKFM